MVSKAMQKMDLEQAVEILDPTLGDQVFDTQRKGLKCNVARRRADGSLDIGLSCEGDPGRTEQSHAAMADINQILAQYIRTGEIPPMPETEFNDLSDLPDYQTCLNTVQGIQQLFQDMPLAVRKHFDHDPAAFMRAVDDPSQRDTLIELGVFKPKDGASNGGNPVPPVVKPENPA